MPDLIINIGGHDFEIACASGEETFLKSAAELLDQEAKKLNIGKSKLPETKMLLMISLIMADELLNTSKIDKLGSKDIDNPDKLIIEEMTEKKLSIPKESIDRLTELVSQSEALAHVFNQKFSE